MYTTKWLKGCMNEWMDGWQKEGAVGALGGLVGVFVLLACDYLSSSSHAVRVTSGHREKQTSG